MDILLIDPPYAVLKDQSTTRGYNLGLTSLAAYLRENEIETAILTGTLPLDSSPSTRLTQFIPNWLLTDAKDLASRQQLLETRVNDRNHVIWKNLADVIRRNNPTSVGITCHTPLKPVVERIANIVKELNPEIKIIVGSYHPTFCPEEVMQNHDIDFVVRGEGEIPLLNLVKEIKKESPRWETIPGIHYRDSKGEVKKNENADIISNLDELPFPARDLVLNCDYNIYKLHSMLTTRGCPYSCNFCADRRLWGGTVRRRSIDKVIDEMSFLEETYKTNYVEIVDGTFTYDKEYLQAFCDTKINRKVNIKWGCAARYDNLDEAILKLMKKANCYGLYIGLESGSNRVLESMNKKETVERNMQVSKMIHDSGIILVTSILLGSPDETKEDIEETLNIMRQIKTDFFDVNSYTPLPGTTFYDLMSEEEKRAIDWPKTELKSFNNFFSKHLSREELGKYRNEAYKIANNVRRKSLARLAFKKAFSFITGNI